MRGVDCSRRSCWNAQAGAWFTWERTCRSRRSLAPWNGIQPDALALSFIMSRNVHKRFRESPTIEDVPIFVGGRGILNHQGLARRHGLIPLAGSLESSVERMRVEMQEWKVRRSAAWERARQGQARRAEGFERERGGVPVSGNPHRVSRIAPAVSRRDEWLEFKPESMLGNGRGHRSGLSGGRRVLARGGTGSRVLARGHRGVLARRSALSRGGALRRHARRSALRRAHGRLLHGACGLQGVLQGIEGAHCGAHRLLVGIIGAHCGVQADLHGACGHGETLHGAWGHGATLQGAWGDA